MRSYEELAVPCREKRRSRNLQHRNGYGRCGGVCAEVPATSGYILNQRVNTTAPVENEVCSAEGDARGSVTEWSFPGIFANSI